MGPNASGVSLRYSDDVIVASLFAAVAVAVGATLKDRGPVLKVV